MTEYYFYARISRHTSADITSALRASYCAYVKKDNNQVERWPSGFPVLYVGPAVDGPEAETRIDCETTFQKKDGKYKKAMRDLRALPEETYADKHYFIPLPQFDVFPPRVPFAREQTTAGFLLAFPGAETDFIFAEPRKVVERQAFIPQVTPLSPEQEVIRLVETQRWLVRKMEEFTRANKNYDPAMQAVKAYVEVVDFDSNLDKYGLRPLVTSKQAKSEAAQALVGLLEDNKKKGRVEARNAVAQALLSDIYLRGLPATDAASRAEAQSAWLAARTLLNDAQLLPVERAIVERIAQASYTPSTFTVAVPYKAPGPTAERQDRLLAVNLKEQQAAWLSAMNEVQHSEEGTQTRVHLMLTYGETYNKAPLAKKIHSIRTRLRADQMELRAAAVSDMIILVKTQATNLLRFMHQKTPGQLKADAVKHMKRVWQDMCAYFMWASNVQDLRSLGTLDAFILNHSGFGPDEIAEEIPGTEFENYTTEIRNGVFEYSVKGKTTDNDYMALFRGIESETSALIKNAQNDIKTINSALYITRAESREMLQQKFAGMRERRQMRREEWEKKKDKPREKPKAPAASEQDIDLDDFFTDFESPSATGAGTQGAKGATAPSAAPPPTAPPPAAGEVEVEAVLADFDFDLNPRHPGAPRRRFRQNPMKGSVRAQAWITRQNLKDNPRTLYVFGDNLQEVGHGGQAASMRGEPNALGIPTKRSPSMAPRAFFTDADLDEVGPIIDRKFAILRAHVDAGGDVVFPQDGLGTGLSELPQRAPAILNYINNHVQRLVAHSKA